MSHNEINAVDDSRLERYGENEAKLLKLRGLCGAGIVRRALSRNMKIINDVYIHCSSWAETQQSIPQEFEWLLDNRYLLEREAKETLLALRGVSGLPCDAGTGQPSVYTVMSSLARAVKGGITINRLELFLKGLQAERALSERELSLVAPVTKAALVSLAASSCLQIKEILSDMKLDPRRNPFAAERAVLESLSQGSAPPEGAKELAEAAKLRHAELSAVFGRIVTSLRLLSGADLGELLQESSSVERILRGDHVYGQMSEETRMYYRQELARLARREGIAEEHAAKRVMSLAEKHNIHAGHYIFREPLGMKSRHAAGILYFTAMLTAAMLGAAGVFALTGLWWAVLAALPPLFDISKYLTDFFAVRLKRPSFIPRMDCEDGLPSEGATLSVITTVLSSPKDCISLSQKLENYYLSNRDAGQHVAFGLLCDLPDSKQQVNDGDLEIIDAAVHAVSDLNRRHGSSFYLFTRERVFSKGENRYMGLERKRGALLELMRCMRGKPCGISVRAGDASHLGVFRFLITLDSDTRLAAATLRPLAAAMLHPLNTPVISVKRRVVTQGHAMLQPRMAVNLESASKTFFTRVYAGQGGLDPYAGNVSEVYQDIFGRGVFVGKGIIHIDAFLACLDNRLPENRVLSHDLLEGSYLRAGFIGDIEWSDGYPERVSAWMERSHRWARGDWQIAGWLLGRVKTLSGMEKNPLFPISRFQIFDNLRRGLNPLVLLLTFTAAAIWGGAPLFILSLLGLIDLGSHLIISSGYLAARSGAAQRFHSTIITGFRAALYQFALQLWFLVLQTFTNIHAMFLALWRVSVSRKRLLSWRVAADSDTKAARSVADYYRAYAAPVLFAAVLIIATGVLGRTLGALWILAPLAAACISVPYARSRRLSSSDKEYLRNHADLIWRYFTDNVTAADNYLPPDNWQEQPAAGLACRTSPTNIGLGLLSAFAALDLGLSDSETILRYTDKMLGSIERLPKWHGHLYNWYDTATMQPLRPVCVSTVDSGNLAGYLLAAREALLEINDAAAEDLAARVQSLYDAMDFRPLYDKRKKLFYIGYDLDINMPTESYYDLLASEARQTSYIAIARGQIPRSHWRRLGRVLSACDRYSGMASWTGTMFEYFMPHLIMPVPENSLLHESLMFAVYCHRRRAKDRNIPWGISESCFYAFDGSLNYQYKAHGEPHLAYKRGLGHELVVSPYSTFLALSAAPRAAISNLKALESLGLSGRYGLCEAADFTPARLPQGSAFMPVRCYMSHHLGMSLLAVDNLLNGSVMCRRFMRDPEMRAYGELLDEKAPANGITMKPRGQEVPEKPARSAVTGWRREFTGCDLSQPRCMLLSNSSYTLFCTDGGLTSSTSGNLSLTRFEPDTAKHGLGWQFFLRHGNGFSGLTPSPEGNRSAQYSAAFDLDSVQWDMRLDDEGIHTTLTARVPKSENAEQRTVIISNTGSKSLNLELFSYLEPLLAPAAEYDSHPAFSKLFLQSEIDGGCIRFCRRARGERGESYLTVACDAPNATFDTSRELILPRGGAAALKYAAEPANTQGAVLDPCALIRVPLSLEPGATAAVTFSMAVAARGDDATAAAVRTLTFKDGSAGADCAMRLLGLTPAEAHAALDWLGDLVFITENRRRQEYDVLHNTQGQSGLWKWGISGDLPILVVTGPDAQPERLTRLLRQYRFLNLLGMQFDFVVHTRDGADYRRPQRAHIMETLKAIGCEGFLGIRSGVHIVDASALTPSDAHLLMAASSLVLDGQRTEPAGNVVAAFEPPAVHVRMFENAQKPVVSRLEDGSFCFAVNGGLPKAAWSHTLANPAFGALMRDTGFGHIWRLNARENKLTPWDNDPRAVQGDETMLIRAGNHTVSPFAAHDGYPCSVTYGFGFAAYEKVLDNITIRTTVFVPHDRMARLVKIEVSGAESAELRHFVRLNMGVGREGRRHIVTEHIDSMLTASNAYNISYSPQKVVLRGCPSPSAFTCDTAAWREGRVSNQCGAGFDPCFATVTTLIPRGDSLMAVIVLGAAENAGGVERVTELADFERFDAELQRTKIWWNRLVQPIKIKTPSAALNNYLNGWALYQVIANRLYARTSLYQCGGAYGFRDQLQDVCAVLYADPNLAKNQILRACAHQFEEGDVQHWWHPSKHLDYDRGDKGVRTKCSDDLLWLPYAVCEYIEKTGDRSILDFSLPYYSAEPLDEDTHDRFEIPRVSGFRESVFRHCLRAIECFIKRGEGVNGLPLILGGDWNDGFDRVGAKGRGESTWLAWFASHVFQRFSAFCDPDYAQFLRERAAALSRAADNAWDGEWYKRGMFDNGAPLGSSESDECKIDSIAQSFSLLGIYNTHSHAALESAYKYLVQKDVILLFTPPFNLSQQNPGYIKGYLPGVRENGGQYTHAAVWLAMAHLIAGEDSKGLELMEKLLPENHGEEYIVEPHVLAADVYFNPAHTGRGGWTHYTGAAAWYYRTAIEHLLKIKLLNGSYSVMYKTIKQWTSDPEIELPSGTGLTAGV